MKHDQRQPVYVTGMGIVSAIGQDLDSVWSSLMAGKTGIGDLSGFALEGNSVRHGAALDFQASLTGKIRKADRTVRFAAEASRQALAQAGLLGEEPYNLQSIGVVFGCGCGPAGTLFESHQRFGQKGPKGMRPSTVPNCMANSVSAQVSIHFQLSGTNQVVVSACTSATNAIGTAFRMIRDGYADKVLCGGVDAFFDPFYYGVWENLGVLSKIEDPAAAVRPFDKNRAGTLLGEGAGALILESETSARSRGAEPLAKILGYGESSDATHITNPSAEGQAQAIRAALADAAVEGEQVAYINAHGTGTLANDLTESQSIRLALGDAADRVPVGACKSYFGHTLGASGALESIATILALRHGKAPANLNLDHPDPQCEVKLVGNEPEPLSGQIALKNSFGFGGGNAVLVLAT